MIYKPNQEVLIRAFEGIVCNNPCDKIYLGKKDKDHNCFLLKVILIYKFRTNRWITIISPNQDHNKNFYHISKAYLFDWKLNKKYLGKCEVDVDEEYILRRINICDEC